MIEELYRTLIMNNIDPNPDTLRMYMRGEKSLSDLRGEYPLQFDTVKQKLVSSSNSNPFRSIDIKHFDDVPDDVLDAYNRVMKKYYVDAGKGARPFYQDAEKDAKGDLEKVQNYLKQKSQSYDYEPDKDYYGVKAYKQYEYGELLPYFMDVENEDTDIHHMGKRTEHDGSGIRGGFSINALPREFNRDEAPFNHIDRILYSIDDPRLKKELLEKQIRSFTNNFLSEDSVVITKSKGKDIQPSSSVELVQRGLDPMRDYEEESVVKGLTPVEEVPIELRILVYRYVKNAADKLGMTVHDFVHSKYVIPFIKESGLALDDIKKLSDMEDKEFYSDNSKSNARKIMERLMSRGYDNIVSDKGLKIKERFL